jgi:ribonuclease PH
MRHDKRKPNQLRPYKIECDVLDYAEGSCIIQTGNTRVLCAASVKKEVPRWMDNKDRGWVTAEYAMLPRSTHTRTRRERGKVGGRTMEIQRLIGRSLRAVVDLTKMPGLTIIVDCDVLQADGGTRTASITGAYVALARALAHCREKGLLAKNPLTDSVGAVSVGIVQGKPALDLDYVEDSSADVDANFVITGKGALVEVQATGEGSVFSENELIELLKLARLGVKKLASAQRKAIRDKDGKK